MTDDDLNAALAPTGTLRAVINTGNAILTRPTADGQPAGISVDLARALAARRGLPLDLVTVPNAAASVAPDVIITSASGSSSRPCQCRKCAAVA